MPSALQFSRKVPGAVAVLTAISLLGGCRQGVLDPQGPIGAGERLILLDSMAIMLVIVVPTIIATIAFAWWFRASNTRAKYLPDWSYSGRLEFIVWSIPVLVVLFLGAVGWVSSHDLDPQKAIESKEKPLEVQVVSLDWKWLFIYPQQNIASVNQLEVPAGVPIHFRLTSATVMNSFFVPQLGSQIYTMAGMATQLSLLADKPGTYPGISAQFSGDGFSDMRFDVRAVTADQFASWVAATKASGPALDAPAYAQLAQSSSNVTPQNYRDVMPDLFNQIVALKAPGSAPEIKPDAAMSSPMEN